jgi:hypothetical protein
MTKIIGLITILILLIAISLKSQVRAFDLSRLAEAGGLIVQNRSISPLHEEMHNGIRFSIMQGDGVAWLKDINFTNGIIEADIRGKDVTQASFVGIAFHAVNKDSLEAVYFRPFNFRSTDSVKRSHAVEYVSHPDFPWERLRKEHPGEYEKGIDPAPAADQWVHLKILVHYPQIEVYVNGNTTPALVVKELSRNPGGKIGLWAGNNSDGDYANLVITSNK